MMLSMRSAKLAALVALVSVTCAWWRVTPWTATFPATPLAGATVRVVVEPSAARDIERLATLTRRTRREQAACVADWAVLPSGPDSIVVGLIALSPSEPYVSDSLVVRTRSGRPFCADSTPNVHTHIVRNEVWGVPSDWDVRATHDWPGAPFRVVVSVGASAPSLVTLYGVNTAQLLRR